MGMEHERVHIETSSVLIRQLPIAMVTAPPGWKYAPAQSRLILIINQCKKNLFDLLLSVRVMTDDLH